MKNSFYNLLFWIVGMTFLSACEEEAKNPGDFNLATTLSIRNITDTLGNTYDLKEVLRKDTTYLYESIKSDTLFEDGKMVIKKDTTYVIGNTVGTYVRYEVIKLPANGNQLRIDVSSNARWQAPSPDNVFYINKTEAGGGDGSIIVSVVENKRQTEAPENRYAHHCIFNSDTTYMYELVFGQLAAEK